MVANTWLEGTYSERYPHVARNGDGMARLFRQFSFPGGIPSHCSPETPGSIHEGGELGYALSHAFGAAFDNPDLVVACVVGDGEAETGPAATGWHSNKFLDPRHDGVVLPILHLNGYKIAAPTVLARIPTSELLSLFAGYGYRPGPGGRRLRRRGPHGRPPPHGHRLRRRLRRDPRHPGRGAFPWSPVTSGVAHGDPAHAQGVDRPEGGRRAAGRRDVPGPPAPAGPGAHQPRPPGPARGVAPQLPARGPVRRGRMPGEGRRARSPRSATGA